jgi:hypothetical protein
VGNAFAVVILAAVVADLIANALHPTARDFISFWGAGKLALAGNPAAAYDLQAIHAIQAAVASFGGTTAQMPFPYPPIYLALVTPFALLPFPAAMALWVAATFGFYLFAASRLMPRAGLLPAALVAVYANGAIGQNAFLTAGIFMLGLSVVKQRPFAAGLVLGCLVIKPQLALLLPVAFLAARQWRVIGGAMISVPALFLVGLAIFGSQVTSAWLAQLPLYATITRDGLVGWSKLSSVYAWVRSAGAGTEAALAMHGAIALAAAALVWRAWRSSPTDDDDRKVAMLSAATALASPYFFFYDAVILAPAFLFLVGRGERPMTMLALWSLPLLQVAQIGTFSTAVNFNAILAIALTALIAASTALRLRVSQPSAVTIS